MDSGSEYDLTCSLAGATRVEEIPVDQQPRIGGTSDAGSVPITHHVWRVISICGRPRTIKFGYGDKISHHVLIRAQCPQLLSHRARIAGQGRPFWVLRCHPKPAATVPPPQLPPT